MRALVIVPTFNERDSLPRLLPQLLAIADTCVLVVDDASSDGTAEIADTAAARHPDRIEVLHRTGARGLGRSYIDGMRRALESNAEVICQMDADLSHRVCDLPVLLAAMPHADLVIGSRYVRGGRVENWPWRRLVLSMFANRYVRLITRLEPRDVTSGFRAWRRELLLRIPLATLHVEGYAFQVEMTWQARTAGARIAEVPITFVERREGRSKLSWRVLFESIVHPWQLVLARNSRPM